VKQIWQNELLRFLLLHLAGGLAGAIAFGVLLLWSDFAGLGTLIARASDGPLFTVLLFFGLFVTFGSIAMGVGLMSLRRGDD